MVLFILCLQLTVSQWCAPITYLCDINYEGIDDSGNKKVEIVEAFLFSHTDEKIKDKVKSRDFIHGHTGLADINGTVYMTLRINVASSRAKSIFGEVDANNPIKLNFIDGAHVFLEIVNSQRPKISTSKNETEYFILAKMDKSDIKSISKCELNSIGFIWEEGYDEYEIFDVDLLKQQIECLKKHT
jgi:hypothetical protein